MTNLRLRDAVIIMNTPSIQMDTTMAPEVVNFDDEDTSDLMVSEMPSKPLQSTFHKSKFNKKIYPSGFNASLARSECFSHCPDHARTSTNSLGPMSRTVTDDHPQSQPKASFMFWAKGLPTSSSIGRHQLPISRRSTSPPEGVCLVMLGQSAFLV